MAKKKKSTRTPGSRTGLIWLALLLVFIGELLFYTWCRVQCVQVGYDIARETSKQKELMTLRNSLNIELARIKAPENISRIAMEKLDLKMPDPKQIITVP